MEQLPGGEDSLAGTPFPRFWTRGSDPGAQAVRFAAASLMARTNRYAQAIEILEPGLRNASNDDERVRFQLALHAAYMRAERYADATKIARKLLERFPESDSAENMLFGGLVHLKKLDEIQQITQKRLATRPNERARLRSAAMVAMLRSDYAKVEEFEQKVVAQGEATSIDLNQLAWAELCSGHVTPKTIETAQDAVKMDKALNFATLHTLASIYAETGKTAEARQVILHAMEVAGIQKVDGSSWYVLGKIAEEYGRPDAAIAAYGRVEKPESEIESGGSTWALTQQRLATLHADKH
jgi:tetratricopeptide (TPR) repeat protein